MTLLKDIKDNIVFYYGTIIVIKEGAMTPFGDFDAKYAMIITDKNNSRAFKMLDLHKNIGSFIWLELEPSENSFFASKESIKNWVEKYINTFYTKAAKEKLLGKIDDIVYIEYMSDYFRQTNRDIKL